MSSHQTFSVLATHGSQAVCVNIAEPEEKLCSCLLRSQHLIRVQH